MVACGSCGIDGDVGNVLSLDEVSHDIFTSGRAAYVPEADKEDFEVF